MKDMPYIFNKYFKFFIPKGLLARFILIIIMPILVVQILAVYLFYKRHWYHVSVSNSSIIATEVSELVKKLKNSDDINDGKFINLEYKYIINSELPQIMNNKPPEEIIIFERELQKLIPQAFILEPLNSKNVILYMIINNNLVKITLPYKSLLNPTTTIFVIWVVSLTILLILVSLIFSKNQIRSIIELTNLMRNFDLGKKTSSINQQVLEKFALLVYLF